jgi:polyisoprenyl-phosphate glycosyltransferase
MLMRAARHIFYDLVHRFADMDIPMDVSEFQLIDRQVVDALRKFDDYYPYIRGMIAHCGFRSTGVSYTWKARKRGFSKNRMHHLIDQALNGLVSFTKVPLRACLFLGAGLAFLSVLYAIITFAIDVMYYRVFAQPGIATLIVALFFFAGVQLFLFGVLGEYIGAIHFQVRKRPLVVERERINFDEAAAQALGENIATQRPYIV